MARQRQAANTPCGNDDIREFSTSSTNRVRPAALQALGTDLNLRVRVALYLLLISPDFVVET